MGDFSRNSISEPSAETLKLLSLLNSLENELDVSYLERRQRGKSHKLTPLEELQDAVQELTQREKDLLASIGISKMLIENNEKLINDAKSLSQSKNSLQEQITSLSKEILSLKQDLANTEEKYKRVNQALITTEAKLMRLSFEVKKNESEILVSKSFINPETISIEKHESDIIELTSKYKQEYENIMSNQ